jgi:hypothetical protein
VTDVYIDLVEGRASAIHIRPARDLFNRFQAFKSCLQVAGIRWYQPKKDAPGHAVTLTTNAVEVADRLAAAQFTCAVSPRLALALRMVADDRRRIADRVSDMIARLAESGRKLFPFQTEGAARLVNSKTWLLLDDQGLGKTIQSLVAAPEDLGLLVVAPATAKLNWLDEAQVWRGSVFGQALEGKTSFRYPMPGEIVTMNYDILPTPAMLERRAPRVCLIFDEIHALKNDTTTRYERAKALSDAVAAAGGIRWGLSGTPMTNDKPKEMWNVLHSLDLAVPLFGSVERLNKLCAEDMASNTHVVAEMLRDVSLRRKREDVLPDLPTKIYKRRLVDDIGIEARKAADDAVAEAKRLGIDIDKETDFSWISKIGGHIMRARKLLAQAKAKAAALMVAKFEEENEPIVLFSAHLGPVHLMGQRVGWRIITGDESVDERRDIVREFQAGRLKGVALTIRAGGVAITLTRAHIAIFVDREWTPAANAQAEDRICRIGQDRGVVIVDIVANHRLDRRIADILETKAKLIDQTVNASAVKEGDAFRRDVEQAEKFAALADRAQALVLDRDFTPPKEKAAPVIAWAGPALDGSDGPAPVADPAGPRPLGSTRVPRSLASTPVQRWTAEKLTLMASRRSFAPKDFGPGMSMAKESRTIGLSEKQWAFALRMLGWYAKQVGYPPREPEHAAAERQGGTA